MDMRMMLEVLSTGMEHAKESDIGSPFNPTASLDELTKHHYFGRAIAGESTRHVPRKAMPNLANRADAASEQTIRCFVRPSAQQKQRNGQPLSRADREDRAHWAKMDAAFTFPVSSKRHLNGR